MSSQHHWSRGESRLCVALGPAPARASPVGYHVIAASQWAGIQRSQCMQYVIAHAFRGGKTCSMLLRGNCLLRGNLPEGACKQSMSQCPRERWRIAIVFFVCFYETTSIAIFFISKNINGSSASNFMIVQYQKLFMIEILDHYISQHASQVLSYFGGSIWYVFAWINAISNSSMPNHYWKNFAYKQMPQDHRIKQIIKK